MNLVSPFHCCSAPAAFSKLSLLNLMKYGSIQPLDEFCSSDVDRSLADAGDFDAFLRDVQSRVEHRAERLSQLIHALALLLQKRLGVRSNVIDDINVSPQLWHGFLRLNCLHISADIAWIVNLYAAFHDVMLEERQLRPAPTNYLGMQVPHVIIDALHLHFFRFVFHETNLNVHCVPLCFIVIRKLICLFLLRVQNGDARSWDACDDVQGVAEQVCKGQWSTVFKEALAINDVNLRYERALRPIGCVL
mmetsp:Transcript_134330/g.251378  ORF Transcript_134330/g.251378 Transcript_134330/m.251378 type:complete len:248 (-) Transcript_134330:5699-6442(-)